MSFSFVLVFGYFSAGNNNVFLLLTFVVWAALIPLAYLVVGGRLAQPNISTRMPEYVIAITVFVFILDLVKEIVLITARILINLMPCTSKAKRQSRLHEVIRLCFVYFSVHQQHIVQAYLVLIANLATSVVLATVDLCNGHTWWLLNSELARTKRGERYMEKSATFFELDRYGLGDGSDLWSLDSDSEAGSSPSAASHV